MKKARMNISHSRFILFKLKIFGEIVTTKVKTHHLFPQLSLILDKCLLMILASTSKPAS